MQFPNVPPHILAAVCRFVADRIEDAAYRSDTPVRVMERPASSTEALQIRATIDALTDSFRATADALDESPRDTETGPPSGEMAVVVDLGEEGEVPEEPEDSGVHCSTMLPPAYLVTVGGAS